MNVQERLWESTFITSSTDKNSNSVLSCVTADRPEPLGRYGSLPQDPAGVKMVDDVLWWWVWISGEEWFWGTTWGGGYPLKDARPWLDPCTAGESAPAKTKPAVERRIEIRIPQVTLPLLMSSFNHEWDEMRWELNDVWRQWTCVKRRIGAANCSKKLIKNREVETLPAGSGDTGIVITVSGSRVENDEPWTLGWVSSRICTGHRRQQEVINW